MQENQGPSGPTKPFNRGRTTPFGDEFVASGRSASGGNDNATKPLPSIPTQNLVQAVTNKIAEIRRELDYIRHLTDLFAPPIAVLKAGIQLSDEPPPPPAEPEVDEALLGHVCPGCEREIDGSEPAGICAACGTPYHVACWAETCKVEDCGDTDFMAPEAPVVRHLAEEAIFGLDPNQAELAREIGLYLRGQPKTKQRAQVCLFQYEEAYRAYVNAGQQLEAAIRQPPPEAWEKLHDIGIERVKGKAYSICIFYDNFKQDGPLRYVFPPPKGGEEPPPQPVPPPPPPQPAAGATRPLGQQPARTPTRPPPRVPDDDEPLPIENAIGGLLGKIRGLFQ